MKRPRAVRAMLAVTGLAFGLIAFAAPAASANTYTELCDVHVPYNQCWANQGGQYVTIANYPSGTAWNKVADDRSWQGHPTYKIITGVPGQCALDNSNFPPEYVSVASCDDNNNLQRYYFPGGAITGAIVSIGTSIAHEGDHWCLAVLGSNIGNARCPGDNLPGNEDFSFVPSS